MCREGVQVQIVRAAWERSRSVCVGSVGISASAENGVGAGVGTGAAGGVREVQECMQASNTVYACFQ